MAKAFVYCVLAALLFAAHSTTAFTLNIHDKMTEAERLVFGLDNSGPMYNVFPMSLTGMERKRKARENIHCTFVLNGQTIKLNLKPTSQYLATKNIPVWLAHSDRHAYNNIRYEPNATAMSDIGEFTMYHDLENQAALVVYKDRSEKIVIEGIISSRYIIRSLPKRFINKFKNIATYKSKIPNMMGGAITSYKDTGFYAVINVPAPIAKVSSDLAALVNAERQKRANRNEVRRKVPKKIYLEFLVVLDHNAIRHRTITQALRFMLAFWNGMDVLVRPLDKPKVHLNIAGIIIANDDKATPYITKDASVPNISDLDIVLPKMQKYFYEERYRFPVKQYDLIVAMTTITWCLGKSASCISSKLFPVGGDQTMSCSSERDIMRAKAVKNTIIVYYDANFGPAQLFTLWNFLSSIRNTTCRSANRHSIIDDDFTQSKCEQEFHSAFFASKESKCYDNKPLSIQPVDKVMPGRWLSRDGQCQNEGFAKSCTLTKEKRTCMVKGCWSKNFKKCVRSKQVPLLGSKCGTNMHCNKKQKCVKK